MRWFRCETCDEEVQRADEYGVCEACQAWERAQGWHSEDAPLDDDEAARGEAGKEEGK